MKKITYIMLFLISIQINGKSQDYHKLLTENKRWYVLDDISIEHPSYITIIYKFLQDTIINNKPFFRCFTTVDSLLQNFKNEKIYVREDTLNKKVFLWNTMNENEQLMYDFTLNAGDTIFVDNYLYGGPVDLKVAGVDFVNIDGSNRKRIKLASLDEYNPNHEYWIEGIGSSGGILHYGTTFIFISKRFELTCVWQENKRIYSLGSNCYFSTLSTNQSTEAIEKLKVFPNPVSDQSSLVFETNKNISYSLNIVDIMGKSCLKKEFYQSFEMKIGKDILKPGFYIATISNNAKILETYRIFVL